MIPTVLVMVLIVLVMWYMSRKPESFADYPGDDLPYNPSSDPFKYSNAGDVGYIGEDPVDIRIVIVKNWLSQTRSGVQFVRIDNVKINGNISLCTFVFLDDSTVPFAYQVVATIQMGRIFPTLLSAKIVPGPVDITNGLASSKFTQGLTQTAETEQNVAAAVKDALNSQYPGAMYEFVTTHSLTNQGGTIFSASMSFMNTSDFPVASDVTATVDMSKCPPSVVGLAVASKTLSANQPGGPTNVATVYEGVTPFTNETGFPYAAYTSIQQAAAPDLVSIKNYDAQLVNAAGISSYK
jgi:hypothetical protein